MLSKINSESFVLSSILMVSIEGKQIWNFIINFRNQFYILLKAIVFCDGPPRFTDTRFTDTTIHWHHDSLTPQFTDNTKSVPFTTKIFCIRGGASNMYSYTFCIVSESWCQWIVMSVNRVSVNRRGPILRTIIC
jgi:hypothetical protein